MTVEFRKQQRASAESKIAQIVGHVLGVADVSADASFLAMGGDSVTAVQVVSRVRDVLGCDLLIETILAGTVADVAAEVLDQLSSNAS